MSSKGLLASFAIALFRAFALRRLRVRRAARGTRQAHRFRLRHHLVARGGERFVLVAHAFRAPRQSIPRLTQTIGVRPRLAKFAAKFGDFRVATRVRRLILAVGIEQPNLVARRVLGWRRGGSRGPGVRDVVERDASRRRRRRGRGHRRRRGRGDRRRRRGFRRLPAFVAFVAILHRFHRVRVRDESRALRRAVGEHDVVLVDERHRLDGERERADVGVWRGEHHRPRGETRRHDTRDGDDGDGRHPHRAREDVRADDAERGARGDGVRATRRRAGEENLRLVFTLARRFARERGVSSDELGARRQLRHRRLRLRLVESVVIAAESSHLGEKFFVRVAKRLRLVAERGGFALRRLARRRHARAERGASECEFAAARRALLRVFSRVGAHGGRRRR